MGVQPINVPPTLAYVLTSAGDRSGVDFDYLLQTAIRESSLNPTAKAQSSSATGLFQFIESTWLEVMKSDGPRLGYQAYADAITTDADGDYVIKDKALREDVLKLRENPQVAADLAAAFTRNNGTYLHERFGRMPSPGELYIAHFMGARGAEALFRAGLEDPDQIAAKLFPKQARANPTIFYELGEPRTIREVYKALVAKHIGAVATDSRFAVQQMTGEPPASAPAAPASKWPDAEAVPSRFGPADMNFTTLFATEAEVAPRRLLTPADAEPQKPLFATFYGPPSP
jgi:Transglycosylase SLT domain